MRYESIDLLTDVRDRSLRPVQQAKCRFELLLTWPILYTGMGRKAIGKEVLKRCSDVHEMRYR